MPSVHSRSVLSAFIATQNLHYFTVRERMSPDHGTGVRYFLTTMTKVEVEARVREQKAAEKAAKLKYRGIAYISHATKF